MAEDFARSVEAGLKLSKRIYYGKDNITPPNPHPPMLKNLDEFPSLYIPKSPMVYAVITDPGIVDNPDRPSYQPYVHGRCDPPALVPLHMLGVELDVECGLDGAVVRVRGVWRVHCVMGSRKCDCRVVVPMGEQGSVLGVEVEVPRKSYCTELIASDEIDDSTKGGMAGVGGFLKPHIYMLTIPQVDGGTNLAIKLSWSQKLSYNDGQFTLSIPFSFPGYVTPMLKKISKKEKIQLNVYSGGGMEVLCKTASHPFKELRRHGGRLEFFYEAEVLNWSNTDLSFSYAVSSGYISGGVLLQSPSINDVDQREMFSLYLFPGNQHNRKVFRKEVVFVIDISGSMQGKSIEDIKNILLEALSKLNSEDAFSIIAFNGETYMFSTKLELATKESVDRAIDWIGVNFIAGGGTNFLLPLSKAMDMLPGTGGSIPIIIFVTDGTVEDERQICNLMKCRLLEQGSICPRIYTFGIGPFCNHYFLQMLAMIGKGCYDAALDVDSIESRMQKLFTRASSAILANITTDALVTLDEVEVYPSPIPDLSLESPLVITGRYQGKFPETVEVKGVLADMSDFIINVKTQRVKDIPIDMLSAKQQINLLTAQAWFSENKELEKMVAEISTRTGFMSEYTRMVLWETDRGSKQLQNKIDPGQVNRKKKVLRSLGIGFGDLNATLENISPEAKEEKLPEAAEVFVKAATNCCERTFGYCCCMCCIQCCSKMNNQCVTALAQLCAGLAWFGCFECCSLCCGGHGE